MADDFSKPSDVAKAIQPGTYKHFKGGEYLVLGTGRHSEEPTKEFVIYKSLKTGCLWIRPLEMFLEYIDKDGYKGPRFQLTNK
jgi:hypothetical protein